MDRLKLQKHERKSFSDFGRKRKMKKNRKESVDPTPTGWVFIGAFQVNHQERPSPRWRLDMITLVTRKQASKAECIECHSRPSNAIL